MHKAELSRLAGRGRKKQNLKRRARDYDHTHETAFRDIWGYRDRGLGRYREHARHLHQCSARRCLLLVEKTLQKSFFSARASRLRSQLLLIGMCRQRTQLSTSLLSARCLACHAARHELMWWSTGNNAPRPSDIEQNPDIFRNPKLTLVSQQQFHVVEEGFLKRTRPRAERTGGQPLARLTPGFLPLTALSVP